MSDEIDIVSQALDDDDRLSPGPSCRRRFRFSGLFAAPAGRVESRSAAVRRSLGRRRPAPDFELARHNIDLLAMLQHEDQRQSDPRKSSGRSIIPLPNCASASCRPQENVEVSLNGPIVNGSEDHGAGFRHQFRRSHHRLFLRSLPLHGSARHAASPVHPDQFSRGRNIVIDTTPDFRAQVLRAGIQRLDAIVYTHGHADHILGLDDVRPFNYHQGGRIPIYASRPTFAIIERVFAYVFDNRERKTHVPQLEVNLIDDTPFDVLGLRFEPIPLTHGKDTIFGFRFGERGLSDRPQRNPGIVARTSARARCAVSRCAAPQAASDAFHRRSLHRNRPPPATRAGPTSRTCATTLAHAATEASLPPGIFLAYDGLEIDVRQHTSRMRIFRSPAEVPANFGPSVVTIGNFDGVHVGHRQIMRRVVASGARKRLHSDRPDFRSASRARAGAGPRTEAAHDGRSTSAQPGSGRHRSRISDSFFTRIRKA